MLKTILTNVKKYTPIVHSITNYVTVNDCANIILASGGSPIMADELDEMKDIVSLCSSLVINIGTLNKNTIQSMFLAGKIANELNIPIVFDPVGAGASNLRKETSFALLDKVNFSVIKGNISEIKFLANKIGNTSGVDACDSDKITTENLDSIISFAKSFSQKTGSIIAISGEIDIVASADKAYIIKNGHSFMELVTGTGCMLSALVGNYIATNKDNILEATVTAFCAMGVCGELAHKQLLSMNGGTNTYKMLLIDFISKLTIDILKAGAKIECR